MIDSSLLDKAILFATNAHKNMERRGKGFPYIVHPLEVVSIIATMTSDQELLAAGALHDVVEDCGVTFEEIEKEFGPNVAGYVKTETDSIVSLEKNASSWRIRKSKTLMVIKNAERNNKIVALGDKLSNIRAIYRDYIREGNKMFEKFTAGNAEDVGWYYNELKSSLFSLNDTAAYKEFVKLVDRVFKNAYTLLTAVVDDNKITFNGFFKSENIKDLFDKLNKSKHYIFDFSNVCNIDFSGLRILFNYKHSGLNFSIVNPSDNILLELIYTGLYDKVDIEEEIKPIDLVGYKQAGDGFTSLTYFHEDGDKMLKVYYPFMSLDTIKEEKRRAVETIKLGISTPICSSVVKVNDSYGIIFERITDKKSISKLISEGEIPTEELAEIMATEIKKVHSTQCNTTLFPNRKKLYLEYVKKSPLLNEEEKAKILKWIKTIPDAETCIHGDFHTGNLIIKSDKSAYFIDMGDFGYGDPRFDLGDFCFNVNNPLEDNTKFYYHNDPDTLKKFFKLFIKKYYEIENDEEIEKICEDMKRFGALTVIYYSVRIEPLEWMRPIIVEWLLNTI